MSFATQGGVHNDASKPVAGRFDSNGNGPSEENFVVANATMWQHLWARLIDRQSENGVKEWSGRKMWDVVVELMD